MKKSFAISWVAGKRGLCAALLAVCLLLPAHGADKSYTVKKNDTIYSIARAHGVSSARLAQFNGLSRPDRIYVGQRLRIPASAEAATGAALSPALRERLAKIRVAPGRWQHVVIHHSATSVGNPKDMDRYHRENRRMANGLAYHFVIGNGRGMGDGEIAIGDRWLKQVQGGHLASDALNERSIGICLVGNFDETRPTKKQMESLKALTEYLLGRCRLNASSVKTHQQMHVRHTRCPGKHFPAQTFVKDLKR